MRTVLAYECLQKPFASRALRYPTKFNKQQSPARPAVAQMFAQGNLSISMWYSEHAAPASRQLGLQFQPKIYCTRSTGGFVDLLRFCMTAAASLIKQP
jgi:hypothetical protein